jgi:hypothetical protein
MKAILIFTAALMTGASIYGVTSYKQLSGTKDFKELYVEKKEPLKKEPSVTKIAAEKKEPALAKTKKPDKKVSPVKKTKRKTVVAKKEETKAEIITIEELPAQEPSIQEFFAKQAHPEVKEETASPTTEQPKKVKKLKRSMFSRARISSEE